MANNEYVNKVQFGDQTVMDISDTTAEAGDVIQGQTFYTRSGAPATGTLGDATQSAHGLMSTTDKIKLDGIEEIDPYETIDIPAPLIHLTDAAEAPVKEMEIEINPVQDFNGYDHPWVGGSQKNLFSQTRVSGTQAQQVLVNIPAGTYTFSANVNSNDTDHDQCLVLCWYGDNTYTQFKATRGGRYSTTITFSDTVVRFNFYASTSNIESEGDTFSFNNIQLEAGSTVTVYEPYENICPISGWNTINIYDTKFNCYPEEWISDGHSIDNSGRIVNSGVTTILYTDLFPVKSNTLYYYSFPTLTTGYYNNIYWYDLNKTFIKQDRKDTSFQVTSPINAAYARLSTSSSYNSSLATYNNDICLNIYDETRNGEYEAYQGHEYEISLPQTVYGGKLTVYGDGSGELICNYELVTFTGQENNTWSWYKNDGDYFISSKQFIPGRKHTNNAKIKGICNYISTDNNNFIDWTYLNTVTNNGDKLQLHLPLIIPWGLSSESTSEEINAKFAELYAAGKPLQIVYELETPIIYQLTPPQVQTLLSENNIWANSGNINKIIYIKDSNGLISGADKAKLDNLSSSISTMVGATSNAAGTAGLVPAPATTDVDKFLASDGTWNSPIAILEYGVSTWNDFLDAYNKNKDIYIKVSTASFNTASKRIAKFSYYNNQTSVLYAEFIYNRIHDNGATFNDSIIKYTLNSNNEWTTTEQTVCEVFTGSTNSFAGKAGLVPAPSAGVDDRFLRATGTWQTITTVTTTSNGLMHKDDKVKLNKINADRTKAINDQLYNAVGLVANDQIHWLEENRKNVLMFLPANQIIILQTTDGGTTWTDAGISDEAKRKLFSNQDSPIPFPQVNGATTTDCGLKILITNTKYDIPVNTTEENKYNYWITSSIIGREREISLYTFVFNLRGNDGKTVNTYGTIITYNVQYTNASNALNWTNQISNVSPSTGTSQVYLHKTGTPTGIGMEGYNNLEITMMISTTPSNTANKIHLTNIHGYGRSRYTSDTTQRSSNMYLTNHLYQYDEIQNAIFPRNVTATTFYGDMQPTNLNVTNDANFKGDIYVNCDSNFENGAKVATQGYVNSALAGISVEGGGGISVPMTGATTNADGAAGLVPQPLTTDVGNFLSADGTWKPGGKPMVVLSYGNSTWTEFEQAYKDHVIVYCRASSNSNPASGSQTRQAFMAYVNNGDTPTEVEFQYYRSVSSHSSSQMSDQVFIYKLNKSSGWSVTTREASMKQLKVANNSNMSISYSSNVATINGVALPAVTSADNGKILKVVNGVWTAVTPD